MTKTKIKSVRPWFTIAGVQDGKVDPQRQLRGLEPLLGLCAGKSVLDLGCAEGVISLNFAQAGAAVVHGIEVGASRVAVAREILAKTSAQNRFWCFDLNKFDEMTELDDGYDIVLCLAIAQKLKQPDKFLRRAAALCRGHMAIRLEYPVIDDPRSGAIPVDVRQLMSAEFDLIQETDLYPTDLSRPYQPGDEGWLGLFRRR
jgi:2-polyprenyl-3-methyl-5-hydroxy-6-metoxy-1,4-benzoquinol methylase